MTVDVQEIQTLLSQLLERVSAGEEIVIARDGQPIARLLPPESNGVSGDSANGNKNPKRRVPGLNRGSMRIADDFDDPLPPDIQCFFE